MSEAPPPPPPSRSTSLVAQKANQSIVTHQNSSNHHSHHQRRRILPEEEYTSTLNKIITRDYYPSLTSLHRDLSVLQKRAEGDTAGAIAIRRAARKLESIEEKEKLDDEEEEKDALLNSGGIRKRPRPLERESVDGFHSRVTSEDNAYFEENMEKEVKEKKDKMGIIYGTMCPTMAEKSKVPLLLQNYAANGSVCATLANNATASQRKTYDESPFQSASDQFNPPVERIHAAGTTKDGKSISETNSLFFTPQHIHHKSTNNSSTAPAVCDGGNNSKNNMSDSQMMPPPPSRKRKNQTHPNSMNNDKALITLSNHSNDDLNDQRRHLVEYQAKPKSRDLVALSSTIVIAKSNEKEIIPENTRFQYQNKTRMVASSITPASITAIPAPTKRSRNESSSSYETDSSVNTDLDAPLRPIDEERKARLRRIEKDRNSLVAMTPTIIPGLATRRMNNNLGYTDTEEPDESDSPIITWGQIASTPLVSSGERLNQINPGGGVVGGSNNGGFYPYDNNDALDESNTNTKIFQLPSIDKREKAAREVEAKLAKQKQRFEEAGEMNHKSKSRMKTKRDETGNSSESRKRISVSSRSSLSRREESLTPAARSLLDRSTKGLGLSQSSLSLKTRKASIKVNARSNSALGSALRASYTPKLQRKIGNSSNTSSSSLLHRATPLSSRKSSVGSNTTKNVSLDIAGSENLNGGNEKKTKSLTSGLLNF